MSYFMTIYGATTRMPTIVGVEFILAADAQDYIKSLAGELEHLDGGPTLLVHDCETGTSDIIIADLENALMEGENVCVLPAAQVLQTCFQNGVGFRIWWANNDPKSHINNTVWVSSLADAFAAIQVHRGATWSAPANYSLKSDGPEGPPA